MLERPNKNWFKRLALGTDTGTSFRPEIQGLRAVAVLLVVGYHLAPDRLPGGFVGVDVFFVISGFLIGGHLLSEVERTGRVQLAHFWARRARRLLPASMLVLLTCLAVTLLVLPASARLENLREIGASAVYLQNWLLAGNAVDYLASNNTPTLVQHFWSLSTEEQFYLAWPLLTLVSLLFARRRRAFGTVLAIVAILSFLASTALVLNSPGAAYFVTFSRAWEFAAGGLLAFLPRPRATWVRASLSWAGSAAIAISVLTFSAATPFPGVAALLPVFGTATVMAAGSPPTWASPAAAARLRPVQYLGAISYSIYLWHFPVIQGYIATRAHAPHGAAIIALLVLTLGLASLTKHLIEDRFRRPAPRLAVPWRTLTASGAAMLVVVATTSGAALFVAGQNERTATAALERIEHGDPCYSLAATTASHGCDSPFGLVPGIDTAAVAADSTHLWCLEPYSGTAVKTCDYGETDHPVKRIALLGDSHANVLADGLVTLATAKHWGVRTFLKEGCPAVPTPPLAGHLTRQDALDCSTWSSRAEAAVAADKTIDTVLFTNASNARPYYAGIRVQDYQAMFQRLLKAGKQVVVMFDVPKPQEAGPICIDRWERSGQECSLSVAAATRGGESLRVAARAVSGVKILDPTDLFCDADCHVVIGGVGAYFDIDHITTTISLSLAPVLAVPLQQAKTSAQSAKLE